LFLVLQGFWTASYITFNGDVMLELAAECLALAEKQGATVPLMIGHQIMGVSLMSTGAIAESRAHYNQALAFYDPAEHRPPAMPFVLAKTLWAYRARALWLLGYPEAALMDADNALKNAREIGRSTEGVLAPTSSTHMFCGNYAAANALLNELAALVDEQRAWAFKGLGMSMRGCVFALTGKASSAVRMITAGITAYRSLGLTALMPLFLSYLAIARAELGQLDDAWRCIGEAMNLIETAKERWFEAEANRIAGEIALKTPEPDVAKAQDCFERVCCRAETASKIMGTPRSHEHGAALARSGQAARGSRTSRSGLRLVHQGFDTLDLKETKALLDELGA
jgi:tetratricopeptide (TPR) repeat protein